ncbi:hypothetical protein BS47DRAFT_236370 [Hydnum rufescens UP504]|uniref:Uncharacterized protein n=1 Tax=Hydnum rufescens UP504 TaxID=1448309 RepID=A0A9P6DNU9_9AGAM|nr:hypothetical protein BS47DRAFT_236370 [Hydnum rufescens UP504]
MCQSEGIIFLPHFPVTKTKMPFMEWKISRIHSIHFPAPDPFKSNWEMEIQVENTTIPALLSRHGEGSNTLHCDYSAVPGNVDATAIVGSPSRDTALRSLAHTLQQLLPGASPSSALRRINDDRVPLVPTDVPPAPRTRGESAPRKWLSQETGVEKGGLTVGYPGRVHASPAGLSALPDGFQEVSLRDEDNLSGDGEDKEDEELIYGRQSHGSIRRRIAEKLRIGSRRRGRAGGRELDDAAVRRVSGTQLHPSGIEAAHLRGSRARDQIRDEGAYRSVNAVVGAFTPQPAHTSPSTSTPTYEHGPSTVLRALNPDHDSETSSSISPIDGTPALGVPVLDIRQTSSGHMSVLPGPRPKEGTVDADGGTMHHTKQTRLIPSSKIRSSKTGPISTPPARYRARGTTSLPQRPDDPLDNRNGRPLREPQSHHPMLDAPQTVLSPPAHPDLFFADPVLGQYIDHSSSKPPASSSTKRRPNISERRRLGVPSPSYTPRKFKVHDRPFQEEDEIPSPGAGSQSSADPPTNTSSFIPPARTRAMQGRVDAIVRSSWGARDVQQPEQEPTRPGETRTTITP